MRRRDAIAAAVAVAAAAAAGLYRFTDLIVKHYAPTPYDDVLAKLTDREQAVKLGAKVAGPFNVKMQATALRLRLQKQSLAMAAAADIAQGHMAEVEGWVLPETVAQLSALAARS
jgi:microcompartment protein CcmL/EutN